jgi:hypothetical protein
MTAPSPADRHRALRAAFVELASRTPELSVSTHHSPFDLVLRTTAGGPVVTLQTEEQAATLHAFSGSTPAGASELTDRLSLDLTESYRWDDVVFEDAADFAYHLLKHMRRRLKAVTELKP